MAGNVPVLAMPYTSRKHRVGYAPSAIVKGSEPMPRTIGRREFLEQSVRVAASLSLASCVHPSTSATNGEPWFQISLAEWSFHKALFAGQMDHLDFAKVAMTDFGITA